MIHERILRSIVLNGQRLGVAAFLVLVPTLDVWLCFSAEVRAQVTKESIGFGHHAGDEAYVIEKRGVGTSNASLDILLDLDQAIRACSAEYLTRIDKNEAGYKTCVE